jgi:hypothetical protein
MLSVERREHGSYLMFNIPWRESRIGIGLVDL